MRIGPVINIDRPVGTRLELWMAPALAGSRHALNIYGHVYVSPAMAFLLLNADTREEWEEIFTAIPIETVYQDNDPQAFGILTDPRTKRIPNGPIDK